ncbi:hypothetical protein ASD86_00295 [Lysobacter sp. Root690]|nr:hypothetical protein ASD86_00295 [Lysobacter sp. Root690]
MTSKSRSAVGSEEWNVESRESKSESAMIGQISMSSPTVIPAFAGMTSKSESADVVAQLQ